MVSRYLIGVNLDRSIDAGADGLAFDDAADVAVSEEIENDDGQMVVHG